MGTMMNSKLYLILVKTQYDIRGLSIHETFQYPVLLILFISGITKGGSCQVKEKCRAYGFTTDREIQEIER